MKAGRPSGIKHAVQGNLDPVTLFASWREVKQPRRAHSAPGRWAARAHLQPGPRHSAAHAGGQREEPRQVCARVQYVGCGREEVMSKTAVLLIAHGSPERVEDIPEFLQNISRGRPMPEAVVREVQHRYSLIGSSPLTRITQPQAASRSRELDIPVYVGMRNWHPFIADTLQQYGIRQSRTCGCRSALRRTIRAPASELYKQALFGRESAFSVDFVEEWHDNPLLIEAFAEKLREGWTKACAEHGSAFRCCSPRTACRRALSRKAILTKRRRAKPQPWSRRKFRRSASGASPSRARECRAASGLVPQWRTPSRRCKKQATTGVFVQPIGFVCDHVEILFDVDILFRQFAAERGMKLYRAESLNDSPFSCAPLAATIWPAQMRTLLRERSSSRGLTPAK